MDENITSVPYMVARAIAKHSLIGNIVADSENDIGDLDCIAVVVTTPSDLDLRSISKFISENHDCKMSAIDDVEYLEFLIDAHPHDELVIYWQPMASVTIPMT